MANRHLESTMSKIHLLRRYKEVHKQFLELERELADLDQQLAEDTPGSVNTPAPRRNARPKMAKGPGDAVRETVRILQQAGEPLTPREIALRMGIEPQVASRYLAKALKLRLVERMPGSRYRVISAVPTLEVRNVQTAEPNPRANGAKEVG